MDEGISVIAGLRVLWLPELGETIARESHANDLIGEAWNQRASWVVLPVARVHEDFFRLETKLAGAVLQKFVNYGIRLALLGDIAPWLDRSQALRDFARETNQGGMFWLLEDAQAFERKLNAAAYT